MTLSQQCLHGNVRKLNIRIVEEADVTHPDFGDDEAAVLYHCFGAHNDGASVRSGSELTKHEEKRQGSSTKDLEDSAKTLDVRMGSGTENCTGFRHAADDVYHTDAVISQTGRSSRPRIIGDQSNAATERNALVIQTNRSMSISASESERGDDRLYSPSNSFDSDHPDSTMDRSGDSHSSLDIDEMPDEASPIHYSASGGQQDFTAHTEINDADSNVETCATEPPAAGNVGFNGNGDIVPEKRISIVRAAEFLDFSGHRNLIPKKRISIVPATKLLGFSNHRDTVPKKSISIVSATKFLDFNGHRDIVPQKRISIVPATKFLGFSNHRDTVPKKSISVLPAAEFLDFSSDSDIELKTCARDLSAAEVFDLEVIGDVPAEKRSAPVSVGIVTDPFNPKSSQGATNDLGSFERSGKEGTDRLDVPVSTSKASDLNPDSWSDAAGPSGTIISICREENRLYKRGELVHINVNASIKDKMPYWYPGEIVDVGSVVSHWQDEFTQITAVLYTIRYVYSYTIDHKKRRFYAGEDSEELLKAESFEPDGKEMRERVKRDNAAYMVAQPQSENPRLQYSRNIRQQSEQSGRGRKLKDPREGSRRSGRIRARPAARNKNQKPRKLKAGVDHNTLANPLRILEATELTSVGSKTSFS